VRGFDGNAVLVPEVSMPGTLSIAAMRQPRRKRLAFEVTPYLFLFPMIAVYTLFIMWPAVRTFYLGFYRINGIMLGAAKTYVGLGNFERMLKDPLFYTALLHNFYWMMMALVVPIGFGLLIAVLLSNKAVRGRNTLRAVLFLPQILPLAVVGLIWSWMLHPHYGPINIALKAVGLGFLARTWLGDYALAFPSLFVAHAWRYYGFCMVIFLAAMQSIDESLYDASNVDGAGAFRQFQHVTLPGLRHAFTTITLVTMIDSFKIFDLIRVMTNGGPGTSSYVLSFLLYSKVFQADDVGYGACVAIAETLIVVAISVVYLSFRRRVERAW
jgi:raffinose/stachyose/melibiose transport system permease protein